MKLPKSKSVNLDSPREILRARLFDLEKILSSNFADKLCRDAIHHEADQIRQTLADVLLPFDLNRAVETLTDPRIDYMIDELSHQTIHETTEVTANIIKKIQLRPDYKEALNSYRFDNQPILKEFLPGLGYSRVDTHLPANTTLYASLISADFWDTVHLDSPELIRANFRSKLNEIYNASGQATLPVIYDQAVSLPDLDPVICSQHLECTPGILSVPFAPNPKYPIWIDREDVDGYAPGLQIVSSRFKIPLSKDNLLVLKTPDTYYGTEENPTVYGDMPKETYSRLFSNLRKVLDEQNISYRIG
jgi:hypothetical protein